MTIGQLREQGEGFTRQIRPEMRAARRYKLLEDAQIILIVPICVFARFDQISCGPFRVDTSVLELPSDDVEYGDVVTRPRG